MPVSVASRRTRRSTATAAASTGACFTIMVGCFVRGELRAVAELRTEPKVWPGEGELAVSVEKGFQGHGFGSGVVRRIMTVARNRSLRRLMLICMINNRRMQAIVRKFLG